MKKIINILIIPALIAYTAFIYADSGDCAADSPDSPSIAAIDVYSLKMQLKIPRIYGNEKSLGRRKYQPQAVSGQMLICYDKDGKRVDVRFRDMVNKTHRLSSGRNVTYDGELDGRTYPRLNVIGDNRTEEFNVASVCFGLALNPSYNIGEFTEDNSLFLTLSGKGRMAGKGVKYMKTLHGFVAGAIGCGCYAYGHKSPTRTLCWCGASETVDDVAAVWGTWRAVLDKKTSRR